MVSTLRHLVQFSCSVALLLSCSAAAADTLDQSKLIDALTERGMDELLLHLAETGEFSDPATPRLIEIGQRSIAYRDRTLTGPQRLEGFDAARDALRALIDDPELAGHPLRPVWRTDLTQMLLVDYLEGLQRTATGYYEFGVPSRDQEEAFESVVPLALSMMLQADDEFRDLDGRLSRDDTLRDQLESSLVYYRIFDEYRDQKSAWFAANAAWFASLMPDDNPYFVSLGAVPGQAKTIDAERNRLRRTALRKLEPFLRGETGNSALLPRAQSLAGRITLTLGDAAAAEREYLTPAANASAWHLDRLGASIAQANAAAAQGRPDAARLQLADLAGKSTVQERLDYRLIVADATHLVLLSQAEKAPAAERDAALREAYAVYFELIDDPSLGAQSTAVRNLVFDRWAASLDRNAGPEQIAALPPTVRMAVADISRRRGMLLQRRGKNVDGQAALERAVAAGQTLTDRAAVGDTVWANGLYNLAYAKYALNPQNLATLLEVVTLTTDVAQQTPAEAVATESIDLASRIAEALHRQYADQPGVAEAYRRAVGVLYTSGHYDTTKPADDRLVYYAYAVHQAAGNYEEAVELYSRQLRTHPNYLEAQAQRLACLTLWFKASPDGARRDAVESDLLDAAKRVEVVARDALNKSGDDYQSASAARALANAQFGRAEVYAQRRDLDRALAAIADVETDFADRPEIVQRGLERRILLLVEADELGRAQETAGTMMGRFPDAAAGVINNVLSDMERQIAALGDDSPQSARLADAAAAMAKLLADWAQGQGFDAAQMLPYRLVVLRSLRIAERPDEALAVLRETGLERDFGNNVDVLYEKAQALVTKGDGASLRAAAPLLNRILGGLEAPYPEVYWRSWVARLKINLALGEGVADVPRRVRQLEVSHPELGGEPFARQLRDLAEQARQK